MRYAKNYKKSIELIKLEIKKDKLNADLYNYLGYALRKSGNLEASIKNYKELKSFLLSNN